MRGSWIGVVVLLVVGGSVSAWAKPAKLPGGMSIALKKGRLYVQRGSHAAPLSPRSNDSVEEILGARVKGDQIELRYADPCSRKLTLTVTKQGLEARLTNLKALRDHLKRRYDASARGFEEAIATDPSFDLARTNWASALALQGKRDEALKVLEPLLKKNPAKVFERVWADDELAALRETKAVQGLAAKKPGSARVTQSGGKVELEGSASIAVSRERGLVAAIQSDSPGMGCQWGKVLQVFDLTSGRLMVELPLVTYRDTSSDCERSRMGRRARRRVEARVAAANRFLRDLGFSAPADAEKGKVSEDEERGVAKARFAKAKLALVTSGGTARVVRGDNVLQTRKVPSHPDEVYVIRSAVHLPDAKATLYHWYARGGRDCAEVHPSGIVVVPLPQ